MADMEYFKRFHHIHMLGIGGISMSGIAEILNHWGIKVTGSDAQASEVTDKLIEHGISVTIGHDIENLKRADAVVYSAAIKPDDIEMQTAKQLSIETIERCDFLGKITKAYSNTIGVSGTHGKTTTTSMVSLCFVEAGLDPTIQVGAILNQIDGNYRVGNSEYCLIEACEYVESFLKFHPKSEIILNIDNDHLDYFKNFDNIKNAFIKYVALLPDDGLLVINGDDSNCLDLASHTKAKTVTYGITNMDCDYTAKNIIFDTNGFAGFDVYHHSHFYGHIQLSIPGKHNVSNALACISLCHEYGISILSIQKALQSFTGAHRRFEFVGTFHQASIYDDYGHHPTEILATANSLKNKRYHESWVVFQPHTYSRTKNLLDDFAHALTHFDHIIITDIYAARESNTYGITSADLADKVQSLGKQVVYLPDFGEIVTYLKNVVQPNDIVLTLGAGTVTSIGPMLTEKI